MPISYRIDRDLRAILTTASGRVTDNDVLDHARRVTANPDSAVGATALVDFRDVQEIGVSGHGVRQVADIFRANSHSPKTAFVTDTDAIYGLSRMFEMLRDDSSEEIRTFRNFDEAKRWLGLP